LEVFKKVEVLMVLLVVLVEVPLKAAIVVLVVLVVLVELDRVKGEHNELKRGSWYVPLGSPARPRKRPGKDTLSARIVETEGIEEEVEAKGNDAV